MPVVLAVLLWSPPRCNTFATNPWGPPCAIQTHSPAALARPDRESGRAGDLRSARSGNFLRLGGKLGYRGGAGRVLVLKLPGPNKGQMAASINWGVL